MIEKSNHEAATAAASDSIGVRNIGEPLRFTDVEPIAGFAAESAKPGQPVKICMRLALSSDEPLFHRLVGSLDGVVRHMAQKAGAAVNLGRADTVLLIFKPDNTAELWMDEGVLNDAYKATHGGQGAKLKELLAFAQASAERRAGGPNTLFFPTAFGRYLAAHTFANFDPVAQTGTAGSRHAVGHGAAAQESYTMTRALQAVLTLDQLAFYT